MKKPMNKMPRRATGGMTPSSPMSGAKVKGMPYESGGKSGMKVDAGGVGKDSSKYKGR